MNILGLPKNQNGANEFLIKLAGYICFEFKLKEISIALC